MEAPVLTSIQDFYDDAINLPKFSPEDLIGMTFLKTSPDSEGDCMRAKVVHQIMDCDAENHKQIKFLLSLGDGELEELISYNKLCDLITEQMESKGMGYGDIYTFKSILDHQGPLKHHDPKYKGSQWNVLVAWNDSTQTWEPLNIIGKHNEISLAKYAKENDLLSKPGWTFLRKTAKRQRFLNVALNAIKRHRDPTQIRHKFGVRLPRNYADVERNIQVHRNYTSPHKTQMIDTTINLLVNQMEYTNLFGSTLTLRLAVKSDNSSPAILFRNSEKPDATIKLSLILPTHSCRCPHGRTKSCFSQKNFSKFNKL